MSVAPKTLDEHRDYLFSIVRLKLWFLARWQKEHPDEDFSYILRERVDIFRKTDINPETMTPRGSYYHLPAWLDLENRLKDIYAMLNGDEKLFEEWGFDLLRPTLEKRCERDFYDQAAAAAYQCGFLRHNLNLNIDGETLGFHIRNDRRPYSFLDDPAHIKECFMQLLDVAENKFSARCISTNTWLNSVEKWLALFPQEWRDNLREIDTEVRWHYGFWGQFIKSRGAFNAKAGEKLRATGKLPFYPRYSFCTIEAMRKHIEQL